MQEEQFRAHLRARGLSENTLNTRCAAIRRVERAETVDLDREFEKDAMAALLAKYDYSADDRRSGRQNPSAIDIDPTKISRDLAFYRNHLRAYQQFRAGGGEVEHQLEQPDGAEMDAEIEIASRTFGLERDMQAALRANLSQLEAGLTIADDNRETKVEAGLIDILAKDEKDAWTIIELKADVARPAVIAQTLAYMASVANDRGGEVRGIIVASDFDPRVTLAAKAVSNLMLKRYKFRFEFE